MKLLSLSLLLFLICACTNEPKPIHFGEDDCDYCRMIISDQRYGGELMTTKGKAYKFDSVECLAAYILEQKSGSNEMRSIWTIDFNNPEKLIDASQAWYLHSDLLKSPMGLNLSAFTNQNMAETVKNVYPGEVVRWDEVKNLVIKEWLDQ